MSLSKKQRISILLLFCLIVFSIIFLKLQRPPQFNILLITIDALRADHLGCYGYKQNTSPYIDNLTREAALFTQAISQASWTYPSISSLVTSTYPSTHGVYFWDQDLPDSVPTLPQILKEKDYYTGFISGHGGIPKKVIARLRRGFDTFDDIFMAKADEITQKAALWITDNRNKRFFLWIHYMDLPNSRLDLPEEKLFIENITPAEINTYTLKYDNAIRYVDNQIGIILEKLKVLGLYKNTIIILTADHGQQICEHRLCFDHGGFLWESLIKVPLIIFYPKFFFKNKIIIQQVQHIDILPTICGILKIRKSKIFEGRSLLPLISKENVHPTYAFSEHKESKNELSTGELGPTKLSIRSLEWKLIYTTNRGKTEEY